MDHLNSITFTSNRERGQHLRRSCMSFEEASVSVTDAEVAFRSIPQSEVRKTMRSTIEICIAIAARVEKS